MKKRTQNTILAIGIALLVTGCQAVASSELKSTTATDLKLTATVSQYNDSEQVTVSSKMQTLQSGVDIELNQGETLSASTKVNGQLSANLFLSNSSAFNLTNAYDGTIAKVASGGSYAINYSDSAGTTTTATVEPSSVPDLTAPTDSATLSGNATTLTWDATQASGPLKVEVRWQGNGAVGYSSRTAENTGSYDLDTTNYYGTGKIDLVNTVAHTEPQGFGGVDINMKCISRRFVTFDKTPSPSKNVITGLDLGISSDTADAILHECIAHCGDDEESWFEIGGERHSCCLRDYM